MGGRRTLYLAACAMLAIAALLWWRFVPPGADDADSAAAAAPGEQGGGGTAGGRGGNGRGEGGGRESLVVTASVFEASSDDRLVAIGDGDAFASVTVVPRASGVLRTVPVSSGERVEAGATLATLDRETEEIARDLAARAVADATTTRARLDTLLRSRAGTQADLDAADNTLAAAKLALRDAELELARRTVRAPIAGVVGIVPVERGDYVEANTEIVTIDDRSTLVVEFRVPERFAADVRIGQPFEATSFALPGAALAGEVAAIGSRVERDSRTLPVRGVIDNADDRLRPGMSFTVTLRFAGTTRPAVDPLAVQWDSQGSYVWLVADGAVRRTPVRIVQRNPESVLLEAELLPGDAVVTEGVLSLREGAAVRVAGGGPGGRQGEGQDDGQGKGQGDERRDGPSGTPTADSGGGT